MTHQYVSNPFQVLGVSDPPSANVASTPPLAGTATSAANPSSLPSAADLDKEIEEQKAALKTSQPSHSHLHFLHSIGRFFLDDALPIALQIGLPILERKI
jgi:hypothetical protein